MSLSMGQIQTKSLDEFGVTWTCAQTMPTESKIRRKAIVRMRLLIPPESERCQTPALENTAILAGFMNVCCGFFLLGVCIESQAHNVGNAITWNREISRIVYERCASCHREGGSAFSLMRFQEVQPRAVAIKEAVLSRTMPPWGAVKGFGDFRNDQGLSQAELELITDWIDSDTPRG